jgi:hypothetical protein
MRHRHVGAAGNGMQILDAQFALLALAARSQLVFQFLDVLIGHFRLCKDFRAEIVNVAGIIRDKQAIRFLISHVTSLKKFDIKIPGQRLSKAERISNTSLRAAFAMARRATPGSQNRLQKQAGSVGIAVRDANNNKLQRALPTNSFARLRILRTFCQRRDREPETTILLQALL